MPRHECAESEDLDPCETFSEILERQADVAVAFLLPGRDGNTAGDG